MKIIDNALNKEQFNELTNVMLGPQFPWHYTDAVVAEKAFDTEKYQIQFVHQLHENMGPTTDMDTFNLMWRFFELLQPLQLIRIKANLLPVADKIIEHGYHVDTIVPGALTAIFYLNSNNGETRFEGHRDVVESKANRLVIFPATWKHTGTTCTDSKTRCVINFNYIPYPGKDFKLLELEEKL